MIQGGDPLGNGTGHPGGPGFPYKNEVVSSLKFDTPGRLAMANAGPNTNGKPVLSLPRRCSRLSMVVIRIWGECGNLDVVKDHRAGQARRAAHRAGHSVHNPARDRRACRSRPHQMPPRPCRRRTPRTRSYPMNDLCGSRASQVAEIVLWLSF